MAHNYEFQIMNYELNMIYLSLGTNLGDRSLNLDKAIEALNAHDQIEVAHLSSIYETEPADMDSDKLFLNQVIEMHTNLSAKDLFIITRDIEVKLGRTTKGDNADRIIDIDILLFNDEKIEDSDLIIPHPKMKERLFVMVPLLEIAPELSDPLTGEQYSDIFSTLT